MCFIGFGLSLYRLKSAENLPSEWVGPNGEVELRKNLLADNFLAGEQKLEVKFFVGVDRIKEEENSYWAGNFKGDVTYD